MVPQWAVLILSMKCKYCLCFYSMINKLIFIDIDILINELQLNNWMHQNEKMYHIMYLKSHDAYMITQYQTIGRYIIVKFEYMWKKFICLRTTYGAIVFDFLCVNLFITYGSV